MGLVKTGLGELDAIKPCNSKHDGFPAMLRIQMFIVFCGGDFLLKTVSMNSSQLSLLNILMHTRLLQYRRCTQNLQEYRQRTYNKAVL